MPTCLVELLKVHSPTRSSILLREDNHVQVPLCQLFYQDGIDIPPLHVLFELLVYLVLEVVQDQCQDVDCGRLSVWTQVYVVKGAVHLCNCCAPKVLQETFPQVARILFSQVVRLHSRGGARKEWPLLRHLLLPEH